MGALNEAVNLDAWEIMWAPYDDQTYSFVLAEIQPDDIVLEIGAGDLRLAFRIANKARQVYAIEIQEEVLIAGLNTRKFQVPANLQIQVGDARSVEFPENITSAVLLMRHCKHFALYAEKLRQTGCTRLITNARWGMGVEVIDLIAERIPYNNIALGWYACLCGTAGFKAGPPELIQPELDQIVYEVIECPTCRVAG
jgi:tRNA/tmRNA/rRNA uracil-C5-methylase (TrmA/RlmC/RlmD family)